MHPLAMLVLVGFCLVIALFFAVWLTLQALRPRPEPEPEPDSTRRTPRPDISNDAVRGAKAPRKYAPVDAFTAPPGVPEAPERAERVVRATGEPARAERRAGGEEPGRPDAWRTRSGGAPSAPSWRARTRTQQPEPTEATEATEATERPSAPASRDTDAPRFGRASRWSWPGGADADRERDDAGDDGSDRGARDGSGGVRVRDRSDDRRRRDEEAFERFLDPKRRDDF